MKTAAVRLKVFSAEQPEMCWFEIGINRTIGFSYIFLGRIRQRACRKTGFCEADGKWPSRRPLRDEIPRSEAYIDVRHSDEG